MLFDQVTVIGGGLAGSECAIQLADRSFAVKLCEMRPQVSSPAHHTDHLAELVCSNSFKSTRPDSAAGLLKAELERMVQSCSIAPIARLFPLAVPGGRPRQVFRVCRGRGCRPSQYRGRARRGHADSRGYVVIAAGPLCSPALSEEVMKLVGGDALAFFDAAAPIVDASTLDMDVLFSQSRYEEQGSGDYLNAPLNKEEYEAFIEALTTADRVVLKDFEGGDLFQACQPAEEVARTGKDAIRFGAMKPVGLTDPRTGRRPWAAIQLRAENKEKTAYNLVGFQTNLTFGEQKRVFHMVPGLENAEFFRYGVMHRNTFVDAPHVLDGTFAVPGTGVRLAGQITGTEGYMEPWRPVCSRRSTPMPSYRCRGRRAAARGRLARSWLCDRSGNGGLSAMHVNFGLVPPLEDGKRRSKRDRYQAYADRALEALDAYLATRPDLFGGDRS